MRKKRLKSIRMEKYSEQLICTFSYIGIKMLKHLRGHYIYVFIINYIYIFSNVILILC